MNTLVPLEYYLPLYLNLMLIVVLYVYLQSFRVDFRDVRNLAATNGLGIVLFLFTLVYIGTRPISGKYFVDMRTYSEIFLNYAEGANVVTDKDVYFEYFMKFCSGLMSVEMFFFLCAAIYIVPMLFATKKIFGDYWFYAFLMLLTSFTFWSAGTNGIRNGMAASLVMAGIAYTDRKVLAALLLLLGLAFHKSMTLVIGAYILTHFYSNTKKLIAFWFFCIVLSLAFGGFWETLFSSLGFGEDARLSTYLTAAETEEDLVGGKVGFRWDFLLFSFSAVFAGWYFVVKKGFKDALYDHIFGTYLIVNGFWILIIRANFSNRFAYLSWFIMGIVIIYPLLKNRFFNDQHLVISRIVVIYFLFTYLMLFVIP